MRTIDDLARHSGELRLGTDFEFLARPEWAALRDRYGLSFREQRQYQSTFMYRAVASGEVDVISAFSSDGRIAAYDLVVLEDPKQVILPYDAIVLLAPKRAADNDACAGACAAHRRGAHRADARSESDGGSRTTGKVSPAQAASWLSPVRPPELLQPPDVRSDTARVGNRSVP